MSEFDDFSSSSTSTSMPQKILNVFFLPLAFRSFFSPSPYNEVISFPHSPLHFILTPPLVIFLRCAADLTVTYFCLGHQKALSLSRPGMRKPVVAWSSITSFLLLCSPPLWMPRAPNHCHFSAPCDFQSACLSTLCLDFHLHGWCLLIPHVSA